MANNRSSVEAVISGYFDGLYEGDAEKLGAIFHPTAICAGWKRANCRCSPCRTGWSGCASGRPPRAEGKAREDFIVTIDRSDDSTAFIKVRCQLPPRYFTDYLVAMKLADGWRIVSKSYRYDLHE